MLSILALYESLFIARFALSFSIFIPVCIWHFTNLYKFTWTFTEIIVCFIGLAHFVFYFIAYLLSLVFFYIIYLVRREEPCSVSHFGRIPLRRHPWKRLIKSFGSRRSDALIELRLQRKSFKVCVETPYLAETTHVFPRLHHLNLVFALRLKW